MGERKPQFARRDRGDQRRRCCGARAVAHSAAAEHDGRQIGLERERAAKSLLHQHGLDRAAAEAAVRLGERSAEQAEFGVLRARGPRLKPSGLAR